LLHCIRPQRDENAPPFVFKPTKLDFSQNKTFQAPLNNSKDIKKELATRILGEQSQQ